MVFECQQQSMKERKSLNRMISWQTFLQIFISPEGPRTPFYISRFWGASDPSHTGFTLTSPKGILMRPPPHIGFTLTYPKESLTSHIFALHQRVIKLWTSPSVVSASTQHPCVGLVDLQLPAPTKNPLWLSGNLATQIRKKEKVLPF